MKKIWITAIAALFLTTQAALAQPAIEWQKKLVGNNPLAESDIDAIIQTSDGGFIAVGSGETSGGDLPSGYIDNTDVLIVKLNASGTVQWSKYWGGQEFERANSVIQTGDGSFVIAGMTASSFGGENHGGNDGFVIKLDASGTLQWMKLYGGSDDDKIASIRENPDGTFIFAGSTKSPEVNGYHGITDVWIVKLDMDGTLIWERAKGYSNFDDAYSIELTDDGGYIVAGSTQSTEATNHHGSSDLWVLKITAAGTIAWQQCIGGTGVDDAGSAIVAADGSIMVLGYSSTNNNGDAIGNHGKTDLLLAKLDASGSLVYSKLYGGSEEDYSDGIKQTPDGGFVIISSTYSNDGDVIGNSGNFDIWLLKVNPIGIIEWRKCLGGAGKDRADGLALTSDGGYILSGQYDSQNGWIIKMKNENAGIENLELDTKMNIYPNPASDILNIAIDWEKSKSCTLTISDITGRIIHTQPLNGKDTVQMDVSTLPSGVYMVTESDENGSISTQQLVVGK